MANRRFSPPWMIEEHPESLNLKDAKGARGSPNNRQAAEAIANTNSASIVRGSLCKLSQSSRVRSEWRTRKDWPT